MKLYDFAAVLVRMLGVALILSSIPLIAGLFQFQDEWAEYPEFKSEPAPNSLGVLELEKGISGFIEAENNESETYSTITSEFFPNLISQIAINFGMGLILIFFCNPLARLLLIGIQSKRAKGA